MHLLWSTILVGTLMSVCVLADTYSVISFTDPSCSQEVETFNGTVGQCTSMPGGSAYGIATCNSDGTWGWVDWMYQCQSGTPFGNVTGTGTVCTQFLSNVWMKMYCPNTPPPPTPVQQATIQAYSDSACGIAAGQPATITGDQCVDSGVQGVYVFCAAPDDGAVNNGPWSMKDFPTGTNCQGQPSLTSAGQDGSTCAPSMGASGQGEYYYRVMCFTSSNTTNAADNEERSIWPKEEIAFD